VRIGEVAERAGVNVETLRYYERRGLLAEPARTPTGHRRYDEDAVRFVRAIKDAQALGFTLAEIEEYLVLAGRQRRAASAALRTRLATKIDEVDAKLASLHRVRDDLARVLGCACETLDHCTCGAAYLARRGRDPEPAAAGALHVTNGESAGNTLRQTGLGGSVLTWDDVLYEGPVPLVPPERLRELRAAFLSDCGWGAARGIRDSLERRDRHLADALAAGREVALWFEHDLYDQLQLVQVLAQAGEGARLELVQSGSHLGELEADELAALWPSRRTVTDEQLALAGRAWDALRAPEPSAVEALLTDELSALPYLAPALRRLLEELPAARDGLSRSERQLLEPLLDGARTAAELFLASAAREEAVFDGDAWAWHRLALLGAGERPLVERAGGGRPPAPPPLGDGRTFANARLVLTEDGRSVLAGRADRVELLGIDRWLGGTHLRTGHVPRWDATAGVV
jgi:DNA-binding transcriptional MerR regulator